jgi:hypothetical protein
MSTKRQTKVRAVETLENADSTGRQRQLKRDEVSYYTRNREKWQPIT